VKIDQQLNLKAVRIQPGDEVEQKANYVQQLEQKQSWQLDRVQTMLEC